MTLRKLADYSQEDIDWDYMEQFMEQFQESAQHRLDELTATHNYDMLTV